MHYATTPQIVKYLLRLYFSHNRNFIIKVFKRLTSYSHIAGVQAMKIATMLDRLIGYFADGITRIFGLDRNQYPATGIQPFEGEIDKKRDR